MKKRLRLLYESLHQTPIAFYPIYTDLMGSAAGGVLLSQMMYWFGKKSRFYKTDEDFKEETHLSSWELRSAKQGIKEKIDFIKVMLVGAPPKTTYEIDWEVWQSQLMDHVGGRVDKRGRKINLVETTKSISRNSLSTSIDATKTTANKKHTTKKTNYLSTSNQVKYHRRWKIWSIKLAKAIAKGQGKEWNGAAVKGSDEFRKLHQIEKVPIAELREHILWYCSKASEQNFLFLGRDQYIPVCGNGYSFRKKWDSLQGAKAKDQNWEYHKPKKKRKFNSTKTVVR